MWFFFYLCSFLPALFNKQHKMNKLVETFCSRDWSFIIFHFGKKKFSSFYVGCTRPNAYSTKIDINYFFQNCLLSYIRKCIYTDCFKLEVPSELDHGYANVLHISTELVSMSLICMSQIIKRMLHILHEYICHDEIKWMVSFFTAIQQKSFLFYSYDVDSISVYISMFKTLFFLIFMLLFFYFWWYTFFLINQV